MEDEINSLIERHIFGRDVEEIGSRWFWVGRAGALPGSPYILPDGREALPVRAFARDMNKALLVLAPFYQAGCSAWIEWDGHTGARAGCTSGVRRFELEADGFDAEDIARAICLLALKIRGIDIARFLTDA